MLNDYQHPIGGLVAYIAIFFLFLSAVRYWLACRQKNVPRRIYYVNFIRGNIILIFCGHEIWTETLETKPNGGDAIFSLILLCAGMYYIFSARGWRIAAEKKLAEDN